MLITTRLPHLGEHGSTTKVTSVDRPPDDDPYEISVNRLTFACGYEKSQSRFIEIIYNNRRLAIQRSDWRINCNHIANQIAGEAWYASCCGTYLLTHGRSYDCRSSIQERMLISITGSIYARHIILSPWLTSSLN